MTSERKIQANRQNARASTGPKTANGRARSAQNALRHGLSLSVLFNAALSKDVEALARELAGPDAKAHVLERARRLAETQIDLCRVRYAQHQLLSSKLSDPYYESHADARRKVALLRAFLTKNLANTPLPSVAVKFVTTTPQGPEKFALILSQEHTFRSLDRYERRALSRRKFAIRKLDEARLLQGEDRSMTMDNNQPEATIRRQDKNKRTAGRHQQDDAQPPGRCYSCR